ncbi:MAG: hypothetical protein WDN75_04675 [Bacteroidota bacterium]
MAKASQKLKKKRAIKKDYAQEYDSIMKGSSHLAIQKPVPQWTEQGDVFVKFSMYQDQKTVAHPHTVL